MRISSLTKCAGAALLSVAFAASTLSVAYAAATSQNGVLNYLGSYATGYASEDGGVAEIVVYNSDNESVYLVNGLKQQVEIVSLSALDESATSITFDAADTTVLDVNAIAQAQFGFTVGDITSVAIDTEHDRVAIALQAEAYDANGYVMLLDYDGAYIAHYMVGVQPDMLTFSPDGNYLLTADEGEPREGYDAGATDPMGTVSIINLTAGSTAGIVTIADFTAYDTTEARDALVADGVILKKDTDPSADLEPEYIAMANNTTAYVALQEANAIATVDVATGTITAVQSLGFKDHNLEENALDANKEDGTAEIKTENLYGVYMPDGIDAYEIDGVTYLFTANEGDAREWGDYSNETVATVYNSAGTAAEVDALDKTTMDGLDDDKEYIFGGRSFSIYAVNADGTLTQTYDSGSDFETITAELYPDYFNTTNDKDKVDNRSDNKGPEPENVSVMEVDGSLYAYIGLERMGGIMAYDVTDPSAATYVDYLNTRLLDGDLSDYLDAAAANGDVVPSGISMGDVSPEGIYTVSASESPNGMPLIITGNEVSGSVAIYQHGTLPTATPTPTPTVEPTAAPTAVPTAAPTTVPTVAPTAAPTMAPTAEPTVAPTAVPTAVPEVEVVVPDTESTTETTTDTATTETVQVVSPATGERVACMVVAGVVMLASLVGGILLKKREENK